MSKLDSLSKKFTAQDYTCGVAGEVLMVVAANDLNVDGAHRRMQVQVRLVGSRYEVGLGYFYGSVDKFLPETGQTCKNAGEVVTTVAKYLEPAVKHVRVKKVMDTLPPSPFNNLSPFAKEHFGAQLYA